MIIRSRAPLRLGLAGGGTDIEPFSNIYGGMVLNATIALYSYCVISPSRKLRFIARDLMMEEEFSPAAHINPQQLKLHAGVYNRMVKDYNNGKPINVTILSYSDAPAGSGLGSSSTTVVAMIKAFDELLSLGLGDYETARLAYQIERIDLGLNGGKQDQYAATFGGINFIEFTKDNVVVNPLRVKSWVKSELESSLLLFYTGISRESSKIINEQSKALQSEEKITSMMEVKKEAVIIKEAILKGDMGMFSSALERSWQAKKNTARNISNKNIDKLYDIAIKAGAKSGKISGAGGGGFMMFLVKPTSKIDVIRALSAHGQVMNCNFVDHGAESWKISHIDHANISNIIRAVA